ncbi:MAG: hypothetical protein SFU87_12290, partial [Chitinophagaceae bacterium]|nr:hypothetical protein [Chitinophagaceae bacterium]
KCPPYKIQDFFSKANTYRIYTYVLSGREVYRYFHCSLQQKTGPPGSGLFVILKSEVVLLHQDGLVVR